MNNNLIIGLPGRHAQTKNGGRLVCATQRQNSGRIRSPPPGSCVVANLLIFLKKIMVEEQKQYSCVKLLDPCYRLKKNRKNRSRS